MEIWDENNDDKDAVVFEDFPEHSDYLMYGPYNFDRGLMRNPIAYWMSREVGQYASRTRFVECFFHQSDGPVTADSYMGVYVFAERLKRHPDRVPMERLRPDHRVRAENLRRPPP